MLQTAAMSAVTVPVSPTPADWDESKGSFAVWNHLADSMTRFHNHFSWEYDEAYKVGDRHVCIPSSVWVERMASDCGYGCGRRCDDILFIHPNPERHSLTPPQNAGNRFINDGQLLRYLRESETLAHHLDMHHRIEEAYIFPLLAKRMPQFADGAGSRKGAHIVSHAQIHEGE